MHAYLDPNKRHDFVFFFDAKDSNPNGDPDAGNMPRVDPETMQGLVTDVCIKRKVRDWIGDEKKYQKPYDIFIRMDRALNEKIDESRGDNPPRDTDARRKWLCKQYYDVRTFGAVLSTGDNVDVGRVTGPIQITLSRSIDPVTIADLSITRQAATKKDDFEAKGSTIGRKPVVLYGLYRGFGFFDPHRADETGFSRGNLSKDLELFWRALLNAYRYDKSALRNQVVVREVYVFSHENQRGNAPAHRLLELANEGGRFTVMLKEGKDVPRSFSDYTINVDADSVVEVDGGKATTIKFEGRSKLPKGVTLTRLVG